MYKRIHNCPMASIHGVTVTLAIATNGSISHGAVLFFVVVCYCLTPTQVVPCIQQKNKTNNTTIKKMRNHTFSFDLLLNHTICKMSAESSALIIKFYKLVNR